MSVPQKSQKDLFALEELCNITTLTHLDLLHKAGWALGNKSADLQCDPSVNV